MSSKTISHKQFDMTKLPRYCPKCGDKLKICSNEEIVAYDMYTANKSTTYEVNLLCPKGECSDPGCHVCGHYYKGFTGVSPFRFKRIKKEHEEYSDKRTSQYLAKPKTSFWDKFK